MVLKKDEKGSLLMGRVTCGITSFLGGSVHAEEVMHGQGLLGCIT